VFAHTRRLPLLGALLLSGLAWGHAGLNQQVRHDITLTASPIDLDIRVRLTLTGAPAVAIREALDSDDDAAIDEEERSAPLPYGVLGDAPTLHVNGEAVALMTLYAPRVDLLGEYQTGKGAAIVDLTYFAHPASAWTGVFVVRLEDHFLPNEPALLSFTAEGEHVGIQTRGTHPQRHPPGVARVVAADCVVHATPCPSSGQSPGRTTKASGARPGVLDKVCTPIPSEREPLSTQGTEP